MPNKLCVRDECQTRAMSTPGRTLLETRSRPYFSLRSIRLPETEKWIKKRIELKSSCVWVNANDESMCALQHHWVYDGHRVQCNNAKTTSAPIDLWFSLFEQCALLIFPHSSERREKEAKEKSSCCCSFDFEYVLRFACKYLNNICLRARKRPWVSIWKMESSFSALHSLSCIWFCSHSSLDAVHTHYTDECGTLNRSNGVFVPERASLQWENLADFYAFSLAHTHTRAKWANKQKSSTTEARWRFSMTVIVNNSNTKFNAYTYFLFLFRSNFFLLFTGCFSNLGSAAVLGCLPHLWNARFGVIVDCRRVCIPPLHHCCCMHNVAGCASATQWRFTMYK